MKENPLIRLRGFGQSVWLDGMRRRMLGSGGLDRLIARDGVAGVTSSPAVFEQAITGTGDYDEAVRALAWEGKSSEDIYEELAVEDIRQSADLFRPLYERTEGRDGFASLAVSPRLARDTVGTVAEARWLWGRVGRPNVMIAVPATREGLTAIRELVAEGINVYVTLLFGLSRYRAVTEAFLAGLEARAARGESLERLVSVAGFSLSRIDVMVDRLLEEKGRKGGEVAIAAARTAYQIYREVFIGERFRRFADQGARPQRLLWASSGTGNPASGDFRCMEALIGSETVTALSLETLAAYREHGQPASRLEEGADSARRLLERLPERGIDLAALARQLEEEEVERSVASFDSLMMALEQKRAALG